MWYSICMSYPPSGFQKLTPSFFTTQMNGLSKQVSKLSQELQEMARLLKPLLQMAPQPVLMTMMPNLTSPPSSVTQLASSTCFGVPLPSTPYSLQRPNIHSLLDSRDTESADLPGCLLPTPHSPKRPNSTPSASAQTPPKSPGVKIQGSADSNHHSPEEELLEGCADSRSLHGSSSNGIFFPLVQDQPPLASHTPSSSLSFSMSLSSSSSLSPCQGPHPSRPGSCASRGLLIPPPSQDTQPPPSSYFSAPPSLTSSPGNHQMRPSPSVPVISPNTSNHPSTLSLPLSLDAANAKRRDTQAPPWCNSQRHYQTETPISHPQELEMQERGQPVEEGKSSTEHISFIDEEEPALWTRWAKGRDDIQVAEIERGKRKVRAWKWWQRCD